MHARYGIHLENYCKITAIEANTLLAMIRRSIFPAVSRYTGELAKAVQRKKALYLDCAAETDLLQTLCTWNEELYNTAKAMTKALAEAPTPRAASSPPGTTGTWCTPWNIRPVTW